MTCSFYKNPFQSFALKKKKKQPWKRVSAVRSHSRAKKSKKLNRGNPQKPSQKKRLGFF